jgi:phosphatidylinositol phospholipase C beta
LKTIAGKTNKQSHCFLIQLFVFSLLSPRAQEKMARYLVDVFGDALVTQPLKTHPIDDNCPLPSPTDLKSKILIKNKKRHHHTSPTANNLSGQQSIRKTDSIVTTTSDLSIGTNTGSSSTNQFNDNLQRKQAVLNEIRNDGQTNEVVDAQSINGTNLLADDEENSSDEEEILTASGSIVNENLIPDPAINSDIVIESKAIKAMSDLVHYIVPVSFTTFAEAEKRNRSYEISSFAEDKAQNFIRDYGKEFLAYNQRQLSRIYPRGTRFDSSNYNPYLFWPAGCQMVALNYQTLGRKLNQTCFSSSIISLFRYVHASEFRFIFL